MMDKLQVLLLGVGNFGASWAAEVIPACMDVCTFAAAVDRQPDRLAHVPEGVACFMDLDAALEKVRPQLVINVTPPHLHTEHNLHLLSLGYPVLCEKPIADNEKDAEALFAYYQANGGFLMIGDNYRYAPVFRECRRIIKSGTIGAIHSVQCHFRRCHPDFSAYYHGKLAQPLLTDVTVHHLDVARYLMGDEPVQTCCETWDAPHSWYGHRPANATIQSKTSKGIHFSYFGTLAAPASTTDWNGDWDIECDGGVLQIRKSQLSLYAQPDGEPTSIPLAKGETESRIPMLKEAISALQAGRKAESDLADNIKTYRWLQSAIVSSENRKELGTCSSETF